MSKFHQSQEQACKHNVKLLHFVFTEQVAEIYSGVLRATRPESRATKLQLSDKEFADLKSQIVISSWGGSRRAKPYAFTEHDAIMLAVDKKEAN